jgi:putative ABC transport system permease protein
MFAQNGAIDAGNHVPKNAPLVLIERSLDEAGVDPEVFRSALLAAPQIEAVTGTSQHPAAISLASELYSITENETGPAVRMKTRLVGYDFFSVLGAAIVAGRAFDRDRDRPQRAPAHPDGRSGGRAAVVVDRAAVAALGFRNPSDALGKVVYQRGDESRGAGAASVGFEIIGVVENPPLEMFTPGTNAAIYRVDPYSGLPIIRIAPTDVSAALAHIDSVWERLAPDTPIRRAFLDETFEQLVAGLNGLTQALLAVVLFGFLVALSGIYGMALFVANENRHEIGVRKSLGAKSHQILGHLLAKSGKPVVIGSVAAWPLAYVLGQQYLALFATRTSFAAWPYLLGLLITLGIAFFGVGGHVLRAARLSPAHVLRYE